MRCSSISVAEILMEGIQLHFQAEFRSSATSRALGNAKRRCINTGNFIDWMEELNAMKSDEEFRSLKVSKFEHAFLCHELDKCEKILDNDMCFGNNNRLDD